MAETSSALMSPSKSLTEQLAKSRKTIDEDAKKLEQPKMDLEEERDFVELQKKNLEEERNFVRGAEAKELRMMIERLSEVFQYQMRMVKNEVKVLSRKQLLHDVMVPGDDKKAELEPPLGAIEAHTTPSRASLRDTSKLSQVLRTDVTRNPNPDVPPGWVLQKRVKCPKCRIFDVVERPIGTPSPATGNEIYLRVCLDSTIFKKVGGCKWNWRTDDALWPSDAPSASYSSELHHSPPASSAKPAGFLPYGDYIDIDEDSPKTP